MKREIEETVYNKCIDTISDIYEHARMTLIKSYWNIGKVIVEVEQKNSIKAPYGKSIIERLSADLTRKYGSGFSVTNLKDMRRFYMIHSIGRPVAQLEWSKHLILMPVKDDKARRSFEKKAIEENLTRDQLRKIVQEYRRKTDGEGWINNRLSCTRGILFAYRLVDRGKISYPEGKVIVDCGFNVWRSVAVKTPGELDESEIFKSVKRKGIYHLERAGKDTNMLYTYRCLVEEVIDGDTLWAIIDTGFDTRIRQKLRLRGIDAPEPYTREGRRAKSYLEKKFIDNPSVVIKTYKSDKYDRYLTDIFYLSGETDSYRLAEEGIFLNQELLDRGLAQIF